MKYDSKGNYIFKKDDMGCEIYPKDKRGNETYPSKGFPFARNTEGHLYYARNINGDEIYPTRSITCSTIKREDGTDQIARSNSGKEKYPTDKNGNEYYFKDHSGKPRLLKNEWGNYYFAQTKDNEILIPWNWIVEHENLMKTLYPGLDSVGNVIFSNQRLSPYIINSCPIICYFFLTIPNILKCVRCT